MAAQAQNLKKVECGTECGFMVKSSDEQEIVRIIKEHAQKHHQTDISEQDVRKMMKPA